MKNFKKALSVLLVTVMLLTAAPLSGFVGLEWPDIDLPSFAFPEINLPDFDFNFSADASEVVDSGTCGTNVTYILDSDGVLTISGTGEMKDYANYFYVPWYSNRSAIKTVIIENGVTSIGRSAFAYCTSLTSITIPDSVTSIGDDAFYRCTSLTDITVDADNTTYCSEDGVLFNKSKTELIQYPVGNARTSYTIPDSVTSIGELAFACCTKLPSVTIPDSVTSIGEYAFYDCTKLTSVTIGNSVTSIGGYAFYKCTSLTSVTIPDSVTRIGNYAFIECTSLSSVTIPDSVTSIGGYAFYYCTSLTSVTIPDSVTSIGEYAFYKCTSLKDVYYSGTEEQWAKISIGSYNTPLTNATIHYNSTGAVLNEVTNGYKREHVVNNWATLNQSFTTEYLAGFAVPLDGSNGNPNYLIPGQNENMIPQGLAYWPEKDWVLVSSYDKSGENPSAIFALDRETGAFAAQFNIYDSDGSAWKDHAGGIGVSDNNLYITDACGVAYCPLSDLDVVSGSVKNIELADYLIVPNLYNAVKPDETAYTAYVSVSDGMLWTGNFYSDTSCGKAIGKLEILPENWFWKANDEYNSIIVGYKLSGSTSDEEWNNLKDSKHAPKHIINLDNAIDCVQGVAFKKLGDNTYKMYLSRTTNASFSASITTATVTLNKNNITLKENKFSYYRNLPGTEGIVFIGDDLHILYESGALSNYEEFWNQAIWNQYFKNCTDVIWKVNEDDLLQIPQLDASLFDYKNTVYEHELAQFCADYCVLGYNYNEAEIGYYLNKSGFTLQSCNTSAARDEVNYFIADKTVNIKGDSRTLVFVGCIGSYKEQWYSNFDPLGWDNKKNYASAEDVKYYPYGFANAREYVYEKLEEYVASKNCVILLTGHSRGAATVNLLAAKLIDNADALNISTNYIYTYAFATPNTVSERKAPWNDKYKSIFNIVNPEDLVTKLIPADWKDEDGFGYSRYGTTYTLPSKTNTINHHLYLEPVQKYTVLNGLEKAYEPYKDGEETVYNLVQEMTSHLSNVNDFYEKEDFYTRMSAFEYFKECILPYVAGGESWTDYVVTIASALKFFTLQQKVTLFFLEHQKIRPDFGNSHLMQTYAAYVKTLPATSMRERIGYEGTVNCPVDVEIYDKATGELVGRIVNNVVDEEIAAKENSVVMLVDGDSKQFWLPSDGDYEVKLIGNDTGTMDYTLSEIDSDAGEVKRVNFFDVAITDGLTMTADLESESFVIDEHELVLDDGAVMEPTEILDEEEISVYSIEVTATEGGMVSSSRTANSGDYVSLSATADEGWQFVGWFENGELLTNEPEFAFVAKSDRKLTAKFEHIDHDFSDWSEVIPADCENAGSEQRVCEICDAVETQEIAAIGHAEEIIPAVAATCTATGLTEGKKCSVCDEILLEQTETPVVDHTDSDADGLCDHCGEQLAPLFVIGDVDNNGKIESTDARLALRAAVKLETLTETQTQAADADKNGKLEAADARLILRAAVGLETL